MAKKLDLKELVSSDERLMSNTIEQKALINLLEKKGFISKDELLEEVRKLKEGKKQ